MNTPHPKPVFRPRKADGLKRPAHAGMKRLAAALAVVILTPLSLAVTSDANTARDTESETATAIAAEQPGENLQLVVLEAPGCDYCNLFRRYVVPAYETSPKSRTVPLKFIDMNDKAYDELGLDGPVDLVPTTILMRNNREVGRIPGYVGTENFFHAVNHLVAQVY